MGSLEQLKPPDEINQAMLLCLQKWTEKRLDNVVITLPGKDRDLYRLLCKCCIHLKITVYST